jgi:hypothetical protein
LADPARYVQSYDFSAFAENNPSTPLPGVQVDVQLADIQTSTTELRDAIKDVRRSDGALVNGIVTEDSLEDGLVATLTAQTGVAEAEASADEAAASAAAAAISEFNATQAANALEDIADLLESGGLWTDYGSITETATSSADYGSIV